MKHKNKRSPRGVLQFVGPKTTFGDGGDFTVRGVFIEDITVLQRRNEEHQASRWRYDVKT